MSPSYLTEDALNKFICLALAEDIGSGDHSSTASIPENTSSAAELIIKSDGIIAGIVIAEKIFKTVDHRLKVTPLKKDGEEVISGDIAMTVQGNARSILTAERVALNCAQRMSAIATYTHNLRMKVRSTRVELVDTRKTTPLFRLPEKWAVTIGGGINHRMGLYDMIILKDNHIDFAGGITKAIQATNQYLKEKNLNLKIEIEVRNLKELDEVLSIGMVQRIMFDNMLPSDIKAAVERVDKSIETEASGGITEKNISEIAETGVDFISIGALTHSYGNFDLSLIAKKSDSTTLIPPL